MIIHPCGGYFRVIVCTICFPSFFAHAVFRNVCICVKGSSDNVGGNADMWYGIPTSH